MTAKERNGEKCYFQFKIDGIDVCHLGDLGHVLSDSQVREIGMWMCCWYRWRSYTIDYKGAVEVMKLVNPK